MGFKVLPTQTSLGFHESICTKRGDAASSAPSNQLLPPCMAHGAGLAPSRSGLASESTSSRCGWSSGCWAACHAPSPHPGAPSWGTGQHGCSGVSGTAMTLAAQPRTHQFIWKSRKTLLPALPALGTACARSLRIPAKVSFSIPTQHRQGWGSLAVPKGSTGSPGSASAASGQAERAQGRARCSTPAFPAGEAGQQPVTWSLEVDSPHFHGVLGVVGGDFSVVQEALGPWL